MEQSLDQVARLTAALRLMRIDLNQTRSARVDAEAERDIARELLHEVLETPDNWPGGIRNGPRYMSKRIDDELLARIRKAVG